MEEVDGHEFNSAEFAVDAADELVDHGAEILILFHVLARGDGDLDENDFADPFRVFGQEYFQGVQLLWHSLNVIQSVDTDNQLDTFEFAVQCRDTFLHRRFLEPFDKFVRVDAYGERTNGDEASVPVDAIGRGMRAQDAGATAQEMTRIVVRVEPNQVAVKQAAEQRFTNGQDTVDFAAGKRCVQEEANLDLLVGLGDFFPQHLREEHEVVVVDPDEVAILNVLDDGLGEEMVYFLVGCPCGFIKGDFAGVVVEEGPEDGV